MRARPIGRFGFLALLLLFTLWLYSPAMGIPYFGDDLQYVFPHPETRLVPRFLQRYRRNLLYRPLESSSCPGSRPGSA